MRTRRLVLAGAILALQAPALNLIALQGGLTSVGIGRSDAASEYEWVQLAPAEVRVAPVLAGYLAICLMPFLGAFGRLRGRRAIRILTPAVFLAIAFVLVLRGAVLPRELLPWKLISGGVGLAGVFALAGQAAVGVRPGTPAATARMLLGLVLILEGLGDWSRWGFDPWLAGVWAAVAGGALIVVGEARAFFGNEPEEPSSR